jgi:hypothetical protein
MNWGKPIINLPDLRISGCLRNENFPSKGGLKYLGAKEILNEVGWWRRLSGWDSLDLGQNRAGKILFLHFKNIGRFWDKSEALIRWNE